MALGELDEGVNIHVPGFKFTSPNVKQHWSVRAKENTKRFAAVKLFLNTTKMPALPLAITIIRIAPRQLDDDNMVASCKFLRDHIAAHLIPGKAMGRADDDSRLKFYYAQRKGKSGDYALEIQFFPL